jgi:2-oxo-3-hexenedioate decarboxylase
MEGLAMTPETLDRLAGDLVDLLGTGRQIPPISRDHPELDLPAAYAIAARVRDLRRARGERPVGRKIGFTNTTIWDRYNVTGPMWGHVYAHTVHDLPAASGRFALAGLPEPRIEPEIVFGLAAAPNAAMTETALLDCIGWVAHGFEIVQSVYPGWVFTAADTAAAFGLHGALLIGPRHSIDTDRRAWGKALADFTVELRCGATLHAEGHAANVLGGPVRALRFLVEELARNPAAPPLSPGEIVTTGTLTDAMPVRPGETWTSTIAGLDVEGLSLTFD